MFVNAFCKPTDLCFRWLCLPWRSHCCWAQIFESYDLLLLSPYSPGRLCILLRVSISCMRPGDLVVLYFALFCG